MFLKISKKIIVLVFSLIFIAANTYAQSKYYPLNLSLFYPLSINDSKDTAAVNINLLYSKIAGVDYFNLSTGVTIIDGRMNGVQLGLGLTYFESEFNGFSFTLGPNLHSSDVNGFEISLLTNMILGNLHGGQISGGYNFVIGNVNGIQISPFFNIIGGYANFLQIGNANIVGKNFSGVQLGFVFNFTGFTVRGLQASFANLAGQINGAQVGLVNITHDQKGFQLGFFNKAVSSSGVQIGLVNYTLKQKGVPIGLVNISDDSKIRPLSYISNFSVLTLGIKLTSHKFYSIIELGWNHVRSNNSKSFILGYHYGYDFELTNSLNLSPDLGYVQIFDNDVHVFEDNEFLHQFAIQARLSLEFKIQKYIQIFVGTGLSRSFILYKNNHSSSSKMIVFSGISFL